MCKLLWLATVLLLVAGVRPYVVTAQDVDDAAVTRLTSADPAVRSRAAREILAKRNRMIQGLMQVSPPKTFEAKGRESDPFTLAVQVLGELRASEAIPKLVEHLDYEIDISWKKVPPGTQYPCALALSKIGMESVSRVAEHVAKETDGKRRMLGVWVIYAVLGESLGSAYLEQQLPRRLGTEADRIRQAIADIKKGNALVRRR